MIKSILGGKSKNLFDISKVAQSAKLKNNGNGTLTVSGYGISAGILRDLCPNIKIGDTIKAYYTPISWTAPNPPRVIVISGHTMDRLLNPSFVVTEADLNGKVYFYNNNHPERDLPGTTVIGNIFITNDTTVTAANYKDRYVPHELTSYKSIMKVSDCCFVTSFDERMPCKTKNLFDIDNAVPFKFNDENPQSSQVSLKDRIYTTTVNNYNFGSGLKIKDKWVLPAGSYVVRANIVDFSATVTEGIIGWYYNDIDGKRHYGANRIIKPKIGMQALTTPFNIPEGIQDFRVYLSWQNNNPYTVGFISYKDIQVMKSDITATDYVPYGYV